MRQPRFTELAYITISAAEREVNTFNATLVPEAEYRYLCAITAPNIAEVKVVEKLREAGIMRVQMESTIPLLHGPAPRQQVHGYVTASLPANAASKISIAFGGLYELDSPRHWYRLKPGDEPALVVFDSSPLGDTRSITVAQNIDHPRPFSRSKWRAVSRAIKAANLSSSVTVGEDYIVITHDKARPIAYDLIVQMFALP